jgi:hypothetical protein
MNNNKLNILTIGESHSQADGFGEGDTVLAVNAFVKRQTPQSRFSFYSGSNDELLRLVAEGWNNAKPGYRTGVLVVPVSPSGFFSGVVRLEAGDALEGVYEARREGETPRKALVATGREKLPAKSVDVVMYSSEVLAEDNDNELPPEENHWEVISINASPDRHEMPIDPNVLMHNHFGSSGGTKTNLSDEQFVATLAHSFRYWNDKALAGAKVINTK